MVEWACSKNHYWFDVTSSVSVQIGVLWDVKTRSLMFLVINQPNAQILVL